MPAAVVIAQTTGAPSPILPSGTETLSWAVFVIAPLVAAVVIVVLLARYFRRLRRAAEEAATRAAAAQSEVAALRAELQERSA
jgi:cytochrome c-type biogenesis protein CcmH/NrfF